MSHIRDELTKRISLNRYNEDYCISEDDVTTAMRKLKLNRNDGGNDLAIHIRLTCSLAF